MNFKIIILLLINFSIVLTEFLGTKCKLEIKYVDISLINWHEDFIHPQFKYDSDIKNVRLIN